MPKLNYKKILLLPVLFVLGLLFCLIGGVSELPLQIEKLKIKVESPTSFEFKDYDLLLGKYVKNGLIDYASLKKDPGLELAYSQLEKTSPTQLKGKLEELCFWVNCYNFLIIKNITEQYPTENIAPKSGNASYIVGGEIYRINQIRDEVLPDLIGTVDWRAVFLLCNGNLSAPKIASHAYRAAIVSEDIDHAFENFVTSKENYRVNEAKKDFSISPFYLWNYKYFSQKYSSAFEMVNETFPQGKQLNLDAVTRSYSMPYDRRINDLALVEKLKTGEKDSSK